MVDDFDIIDSIIEPHKGVQDHIDSIIEPHKGVQDHDPPTFPHIKQSMIDDKIFSTFTLYFHFEHVNLQY